MPLCKIIKEWENADNWTIGDRVDITDPWLLIQEGKAILLDEEGKEMAPPGTEMKCPICVYTGTNPFEYARHILSHEKKEVKITEKMEERVSHIVEEPRVEKVVELDAKNGPAKQFKDMTNEEKKAWRIENLRRGREARKAKQE